MSADRDAPPARETSGSIVDFHRLMPFRIGEILLVSSLYDAFILQEDGQLGELILSEFLELNMRRTPGVTHVASGEEALAMARASDRFDLIITTINPGDIDAATLAHRLREAGLDTPVVVLGNDYRELADFAARHPSSEISRMFLWQGDARILLAIVNSVEDERNAPHDTLELGVRVILVVEDNVRYYSAFLPTIYTELITQSRSLISEGINLAHKVLRMKARPKILLCTTFDEAWRNWTKYRNAVLGVISDIEFPRNGKLSREAGFDLAAVIRRESPDVPIVLQSSHPEYGPRARAAGCSFLLKGSPTLLSDLRSFMIEQFAFGDFIFRLPDGTEVGRASDLKELEARLRTAPAESIAFHAERDHFSNWLTARTEFALARKLKPRKIADYPTLEDLRRDLIGSIADYRREQADQMVSDFDPATFDGSANFLSRIGRGSMGGKARGLAFVRHLLNMRRAQEWYPGVRIAVPPAVVIGTDVFDEFLGTNGLLDFAMNGADDEAIRRRFTATELPDEVRDDLAAFLDLVTYPLAVRSSSLLEDSQYRPFTGVYETYMLPNNDPDPAVRLTQLTAAIKSVYASTFSQHAKAYFKSTPYRLEEEKMAVIIQKLVGSAHHERFYPDFAGVARSYNFYPSPPMTPRDGIAAVALGLGRTVVEGEKCMNFCPRYPHNLVQFSSPRDMLNNSQREFWALELGRPGALPELGRPGALPEDHGESPRRHSMRETRYALEVAEEDGTLGAVASTYSRDNETVYDGIGRPGIRLVSFAPVLKHGLFPIAGILNRLLEIGSQGLGWPVEIEFAVRLGRGGAPSEFGFLQMRPLVVTAGAADIEVEETDPGALVCRSSSVLGNGSLDQIRDVIVVDFHTFARSRSVDAAREVARFNAMLAADRVPYVLIGVGRWGSTDPWLGIPVTWDQISGAQVIVETGFKDIRVLPSQGSHFFQNLTAFRIGYFTVNPEIGEGFVDWDWLGSVTAEKQGTFVRHLRFAEPLVVRMNGRTNQGIIYKPGMAR